MTIPYEGDPREGKHGHDDSLKRDLMARAKEAGLLSPQVGKEWGSLGLDMRSIRHRESHREGGALNRLIPSGATDADQ